MKEKSTKMTDLLALTVFAVFALCVLLVLLSGAKVYRKTVRCSEENFAHRTAARYVTTRVRQAESVYLADFDGCEALVIPETVDGQVYLTYVYCHDGYIRELYCAEGAALGPENGEKILEADGLRFSAEQELLTVELDGQTLHLHLAGKEAAP